VSLVSNALACCNLRISASIASTMPVMSMTHSTAKFEVSLALQCLTVTCEGLPITGHPGGIGTRYALTAAC
jgi:hypothetical protein